MGKVVTKKYWVVGHIKRANVMQVGDQEGHLLGMFESRGLAHIENDVAAVTSWVQGDLVKGSGPMRGYTRYVYDDGSTIISKTQYTVKAGPGTKRGLYENGYGEFVSGTGRFAGIEGSSSWRGKQVTPVSKETEGDWIIEGTMAFTLLSK